MLVVALILLAINSVVMITTLVLEEIEYKRGLYSLPVPPPIMNTSTSSPTDFDG